MAGSPMKAEEKNVSPTLRFILFFVIFIVAVIAIVITTFIHHYNALPGARQ
jgi:hypothetical protein